MNSLKLLGLAAGLAAIAACTNNDDNMVNADLNATVDNTMMAPADNVTIDANSVTVVDNNMMATDTNMTTDANSTTNTTNSY